MQLTPLKVVIAIAWLIAVGALGMYLPATTITGWVAVLGFGLMPAVFMLRAWRQPSETISESIQAETRR